MQLPTSVDIQRRYNLAPLPGEGGFFRETFRDDRTLDIPVAGSTAPLRRAASTAIYYLVDERNFSNLHALTATETYHFYDGSPAELLLIWPNGDHRVITLGRDLALGHVPQFTIPAGVWQGVRLGQGPYEWSLMGTTVAPGFEFEDFRLGRRAELLSMFPSPGLAELITRYTRE